MQTITLPPAAALEAAAAELNASAPDAKRRIAISKALYDLLLMTRPIMAVAGAFLVPSTSRAGLVHRVDHVNGCDCEAGRAGRACRHQAALELIEQANARTMPALLGVERAARLAAAAEAAALLNECF